MVSLTIRSTHRVFSDSSLPTFHKKIDGTFFLSRIPDSSLSTFPRSRVEVEVFRI